MNNASERAYLDKADGHATITTAGHDRLQSIVTDTTGPVYAFTGDIAPDIIAAAMARLSRRGDDMRVTLLDEFLDQQGREEALLRRVITQYGDDSVQQLNGLWVVVEGTSKLMTNILERGRIGAAYLEQSTRYIYYDQVDEQGCFRYLTPGNLPERLQNYYRSQLDLIFSHYQRVVRGLTDYIRQHHPQGDDPRAAWLSYTRAQACDAARAMLPLATTSTVGIFASGQALEAMVMRLLSEPLDEARAIGQGLLNAARQVTPVFFERADNPKYGGATTAYRGRNRQNMRALAEKLLLHPSDEPTTSNTVQLLGYWPKSEHELVPHMLYEASSLSFADIRQQAAHFTDEQQQRVFEQYIGERLNRRHKPGRAFEIPHFQWEIVCSFGAFCDLQRHRIVDAQEWQAATTSYGFAVPELVTKAGFEDDYRAAFAASEEAYNRLRDEGFDTEAQYATLLGHRMRFRFQANLRELFHLIELRTQEQGHAEYRQLCQEMYRLLSQVYPITAQGMRFVNQGESEDLARRAAALATEFKLQQLNQAAGR